MIDEQAKTILEEAFQALSAGDSARALELGSELVDGGQVRGFEIKALALELAGKMDEAVNELRAGLEQVPDVYPLWELLGNSLAKQHKFSQAHEAYQKALACPGADRQSVTYNMSVMANSSGRPGEALQMLEQIQVPRLVNKATLLKISILNTLQRYNEAFNLANQFLADLLGREEIMSNEKLELAQVYAELGRTSFFGRGDRQTAFEHAWKSLTWNRSDSLALWLLREMLGRQSGDSRLFRIDISGVWHKPLAVGEPPPNFLTQYDVVADSVEDAFVLAQSLEPREVQASMRIEETSDLGASSDYRHGVYWRSQYEFLETNDGTE